MTSIEKDSVSNVVQFDTWNGISTRVGIRNRRVSLKVRGSELIGWAGALH